MTRVVILLEDGAPTLGAPLPRGIDTVEIRDYDIPGDWDADEIAAQTVTDPYGDRYQSVTLPYEHERALLVVTTPPPVDPSDQAYRGTTYTMLQGLIRAALQNDQTACRVGELPTRLDILADLLIQAARDCDTLAEHDCEWNEKDYCSICGVDGRA